MDGLLCPAGGLTLGGSVGAPLGLEDAFHVVTAQETLAGIKCLLQRASRHQLLILVPEALRQAPLHRLPESLRALSPLP